MSFRTHDLVVNIVGCSWTAGDYCGEATRFCGQATAGFCPTASAGIPEAIPLDLDVLRAELRKALA